MNRVALLVLAPVLACVLALPSIVHAQHGTLGAIVESSAERYVRSRLGVGTLSQSLVCVHSWARRSVPDDPHDGPWCGTDPFYPSVPSVNFCAFTFLPNGSDVLPVRVVVSGAGSGKWEGELPDCNTNPEHCEVLVGLEAVLTLAESMGLSPGLGDEDIHLQYQFEYGQGLQWLVYDGRTRNGHRASDRLLVVDSYTGEWFETKTRPYVR